MKNNSYESNLKMIMRAIKGRGIETAEAMIKEEVYQNNRRKRRNKEHKIRKRKREK
jgi:Na+/phosphate symporter